MSKKVSVVHLGQILRAQTRAEIMSLKEVTEHGRGESTGVTSIIEFDDDHSDSRILSFMKRELYDIGLHAVDIVASVKRNPQQYGELEVKVEFT